MLKRGYFKIKISTEWKSETLRQLPEYMEFRKKVLNALDHSVVQLLYRFQDSWSNIVEAIEITMGHESYKEC